MVASVVLGITVDDTIHLYHGYRDRLRRGVSPLWAIVRSYESAGRAVLATTAVLVAQFGLLTASAFVPTANFGLMTMVALLAGLLFEVLLLPALLLLAAGLPWTWRSALGLRRAPRVPAPAATRSAAAAFADTVAPPRPALRRRVLVCHGDLCKRAGATGVWRRLRTEQARLDTQAPGATLRLTKTSCLGPCRYAPVAQVYPEDVSYGLLDAERLDEIVDEHLGRGQPVMRLALPAAAPAERDPGRRDQPATVR
jgi:(2Fe-2S) ferredoxin